MATTKGAIILAIASIATLGAATTASAQSSPMGNNGYWPPYSQGGYIGLNVGKPNYKTDDPAGFTTDDPSVGLHVYTGSMFSQYLGAEIGYLNMGTQDRAGGETKAQGINLSLVGRAPIADRFSLLGKIGTTYGRTKTTSSPLSGVTAGKESGFNLSYGIGAQYDINQQWAVSLDWSRNKFDFAGNTSENVDMTSIGLKYKF